MDNDNEIYFEYKPLKNHISKVNMRDSLFVIWGYINNIENNIPLPSNFQSLPQFKQSDVNQKREKVTENQLEILAREIIAETEIDIGDKTFQNSDYFLGAIRKLKALEEFIDTKFLEKNNKGDAYHKLFQIAHKQFPWQERIDQQYLIHYYMIFNNPSINNLIKVKFKLSYEKICIIGLILYGYYQNNFSLTLPIQSDLQNIEENDAQIFLDFLSEDVQSLQKKIKQNRTINKNFFICINPLRRYPLIKTSFQNKNHLICPFCTLLFWCITKEIFYELVRSFNNFGILFGKSFEDYVNKVIEKANKNKNIHLYTQLPYNKSEKLPVDFIVDDNNSILFVECKTKRVPITAIQSKNELDSQLNILADGIKQIYKFYIDYKNNNYPYYKFQPQKSIFPLLVTLEDWYIFGDYYLDKLNLKVKKLLKNENIDSKIVDKIPFSMCSISEFEAMIQIIQRVGIKKIMDGKILNREYKYYSFGTYFLTRFKEELKEYKFLFQGELDEIIEKYKDKK